MLLAFLFVVSMPFMAFAQKFSATNGDGVKINYEILSTIEKTVQVIGGDRSDVLIIPPTVEHKGSIYRVIAIKAKAYMPVTKFVHRIRRLVMPEGLETIEGRAFLGAFNSNEKESIYIPSTVRTIGKHAFSKTGLTPSGATRKCIIENLPSFVNQDNCEDMGLTKSSISIYYASRQSKPANQSQQHPTVQLQNTLLSHQPEPQPESQSEPSTNVPSSDVDINLPTRSDMGNDNTFAIIFANENYQEEVKVEFALNDGEMFKEYCHKVLGMPEHNVHIHKDATLNNIKAEISWMQKVAEAYNGHARFIVFYAGHGIPDEKSGSTFLLPVDGKGTMLDTGYSLNKLYETLGNMPAERVTVFMDACFSGSKRGEGMLASARGVAIKAKPQVPQGKMVVFSAAQGDETAYPYKEKEHGLFTYFLLKKLQDTKGDCTLGELGDYVKEQVSRRAIVINGKSQPPMLIPSVAFGDTWKNIKLNR